MSHKVRVICYDRFCPYSSGYKSKEYFTDDFAPTCTRDDITLDNDAQCIQHLYQEGEYWDLETLEREEVD